MALRLVLTPGRGPTLKEISARLKAMDEPEVGRLFRRNLRVPVASMRREVRLRILSIPTHDGHTGLRLRLARCVTITARTTATGGTGRGKRTEVAIFMDVHKMPPGQYALPLTMEGVKVWRHPVFGNRAVWVTQEPHPYFYPVIAEHGAEARAAVDYTIEEIKKHVDG